MITDEITEDQLRELAGFIQIWRRTLASGAKFDIEHHVGGKWREKLIELFRLDTPYRIVLRPYEAWYNFYPTECPYEHPTHDKANTNAGDNRTACRLMREVVGADESRDIHHQVEPLTARSPECSPETLDKSEPVD